MYSWIDNTISGLQDIYNTNNIYDLYGYLEIEIIELDSNNVLLRENEAFYNRDYFENEVVFIRNDLNLHYKKFVLAHELGHSLLHTHIYEAAFNKELLNIGKLERQANYFAFKLLNIDLDPIAFKDFTIPQIASFLYLPVKLLE